MGMATPLKVFLLTTVCLLLASRIGSMAVGCGLVVPVAKAVGHGQFSNLGGVAGDSPAERGGPHEVGPRGKTFPRPKVLPEGSVKIENELDRCSREAKDMLPSQVGGGPHRVSDGGSPTSRLLPASTSMNSMPCSPPQEALPGRAGEPGRARQKRTPRTSRSIRGV
jgi:hypothetical protein